MAIYVATLKRIMNKQQFQIQRIQKMMKEESKKRYCKNHLLSKWATGYKKCAEGYKKNEKCEEGI